MRRFDVQLLGKNETKQCLTKQNEQDSASGGTEERLENATKIGTVPLNGLQEASGEDNQVELSAKQKKTLTDEIDFSENKAVDMQLNLDKTSLC